MWNCGQLVMRALPPSASRMTRPAAGPSDMATATALFASMTGEGSRLISSPYSAAISRQSVWSALGAHEWHAAIAACNWYGPGRPARSAVSSRRSPSAIFAWSQRARSWSASSTSSPASPVRAPRLASVRSSKASSPVVLRLAGQQSCQRAGETYRLVAQLVADEVRAGGSHVPL